MNIIKRLVLNMIGEKELVTPVFDPFLYSVNTDSYCGGTLANEKILIVVSGDSKKVLEIVSESLKREKCEFEIKKFGDSCLFKTSSVGPYSHVINCLEFEATNESVSIKEVYKLLQKETDYLVKVKGNKSLCTCVVCDNNVTTGTISTLIKGLAGVLGNHNIICNGAISKSNLNLKNLMNTALYLSSKYGQILAGEVMEMTGRVDE